MKKFLALLISAVVLLSFTGCLPKKSDNDVLAAVKKNIDAMNTENIEEYMSVIDTPNYEEMKATVQSLFDAYDLKVEVSDLKVKKQTDTEAEVSCTQITKKVSGPEFKDNKTKAVHYLKKVDGNWKIYKTDVISVEEIK